MKNPDRSFAVFNSTTEAPAAARSGAVHQNVGKLVVIAGLAIGSLASCSLPGPQAPASLYTLTLPALGAPQTSCALQFALRDIEIAGALDRPEVSLRREGPRLISSPNHLWAAPLRSELQRLLGIGLEQSLQGARQWPYPLRQGQRPDVLFSLGVDDLAIETGQVIVQFRWQAWTPGTPSQPAVWLAGQSVRIQRPLQGHDGAADLTVRASQAVNQMSLALGQALEQWSSQVANEAGLAAACKKKPPPAPA